MKKNSSHSLLTFLKNYSLLMLIFVIGIFVFFETIQFYHTKMKDYITSKQKELELSYNIIIQTYLRSSEMIYNEVINQPEIWNILEDANSSDTLLVNNARKRLLEKLNPVYQRLEKLDVRQFHFHLPDNRSFLRFHRPEKFGDDLTNIRYSVKMANQKQKSYFGFEEGRIFNGFRYVFPISNKQKKHLGSVEISVNFKIIAKEMNKIFPKEYIFLIDKNVIKRKVFSSEFSNYKKINLSNHFMVENYITISDKIDKINSKIKERIKCDLENFNYKSITTTYNNELFLIQFYPISNVQGQSTGYIVSYEKEKTIPEIKKIFLFVVFFQILFFLILFIGIVKLNKSNSLLRSTTEKLQLDEQRLKILNKIIRHDLSNDFVVIKSAIALFKKRNDPTMLEEVNKRVEKSLKAIADYKKYQAFIESNQDIEIIPIHTILEEISLNYEAVHITLKGKCEVYADDALKSVFVNLINNSIRHGKASEIDILSKPERKTCKIIYKDNGIGIPEKIINNIFDEGFTYGKTGNTGIGLHIVKQTIQRYDGKITVKENHPSGVIFTIFLRKALDS